MTRLVADWTAHRDECPAVPERPCEHCGTPTRNRSSGSFGWPACPGCHEVWVQRPAEQQRRERQIAGIKAREAQRAKARRLRAMAERDGMHPDVVTAFLSGGLVPDVDQHDKT